MTDEPANPFQFANPVPTNPETSDVQKPDKKAKNKKKPKAAAGNGAEVSAAAKPVAQKKARKKREPRPAMIPLSMVSAFAKMKPDELSLIKTAAGELNKFSKKARARIVQALIQLVA